MIKTVKRHFSFFGKTSQEDYWKILIFLVLASFVVMLIERPFYYLRLTTGSPALDLAFTLLWIPVVWMGVATSRRRLRDTAQSPWWLLCLPVPFLNLIAIIALGCLASKNLASKKA